MERSDWLWWAALLVQLLAIPGAVLPVLPGLVLLPVGALLWCWAVGFGVGWPALLLASLLCLLGWAADLLAMVLGASRLQASRWAYVGAAIGLVVGMLGLLPALPVGGPLLGALLGPLLGASLAELLAVSPAAARGGLTGSMRRALLVGLAGTLAARGPRRWRWNLAGLALSTAYLGWSAAAQQHVEGVVRAQISQGAQRADAAPVERVLVTPTAFNTVLWRVVLMRPDGYEEGFHSLLDGGRPIRYTAFPHDRALYEQVRGLDAVARIAEFSRGFFRVDERDGVVRITDLRMGQEPAYVFSFAVARRGSAPQPLDPPLAVGGRDDIDIPAALRWLWRRMGGEDIDPPR